MRYSDDNEPQGTAGMPILEVLRHEGLVDVCCVVTRYFGGILLGRGGLVRAYTEGAKVAVAASGVAEMRMFSLLLIACPYHLLGVVQQLLPAHDCTIDETDYGADVTLTVSQPAGGLAALNEALAEANIVNKNILTTTKREESNIYEETFSDCRLWTSRRHHCRSVCSRPAGGL